MLSISRFFSLGKDSETVDGLVRESHSSQTTRQSGESQLSLKKEKIIRALQIFFLCNAESNCDHWITVFLKT